MLAKALTLGGTGLGLARRLLSSVNGGPAVTADGKASEALGSAE